MTSVTQASQARQRVRRRILACRGVPTLDAWIVRAATAERAEGVLR